MKKQKGEIIIAVMFLFIIGISAYAATNSANLETKLATTSTKTTK